MREGVPDRLDPVRRARRSGRRAERRSATLHERGVDDAYLYGAASRRRRPRRVLPADRAARALRPAGAAPTRRSRRTSCRRRWRRSAPAARGGGVAAALPARDSAEQDAGRRPRGSATPATARALAAAATRRSRWSYLYGDDTRGAGRAASARRGRLDDGLPMIKPPAGRGRSPLYFWLGGMARRSRSSRSPATCAGDHRDARGRAAGRARRRCAAARPPLLIDDLGRPGRFQHMLRISSRARRCRWAVGADALRQPGAARGRRATCSGDRAARALGAANALAAASSAPTPACCSPRPRCRSGRARGCSSARSSSHGDRPPALPRAAGVLAPRATRGARGPLSACRRRPWPPSHACPRQREAARAIRGAAAHSKVMKGAKGRRAPGSLQATRQPKLAHAASVIHLAAGLAFRFAWVRAGHLFALDDRGVAAEARRGIAGEVHDGRPLGR